MNTRTVGIGAVTVGAVAQAAGLGIDAWLHTADPDLAANEGLFTFTNAGHALLIGGLTLTMVGVALTVLGPWLYERPGAASRRLQALRFGAPLTVAVLISGGFVVAGNSSLAVGGGHQHGDEVAAGDDHHGDGADTAAGGVEGESAAAVEEFGLASSDHGHGHEVPPNVPIDAATRDALAAELVTARDTAMQFPTVADAEAAGYRMVTRYIPLIGAHYINFRLMDGTFDVTNPEMLLYDGTDPGSRLTGLSYYVVSGEGEPEGFVGPNDHWHQHIGLCLRNGVVVGGENLTEEQCAARGGAKVEGADGWMVHAWVVPGWESPQGVFSPEHADLR